MKYSEALGRALGSLGCLVLSGVVLLCLPMLCALAQGGLLPEGQTCLTSVGGTLAVKRSPATGNVYVLNGKDRCIWVFDSEGKQTGRISSAGMGPADLLAPVDFAVDNASNVIVADGSRTVKVFNRFGQLTLTVPFERPHAVGVLSDGRILVSGFPKDSLISVFSSEGVQVGTVGQPFSDESDPFLNQVMNLGKIIVDDGDNVYYVFIHRLTPTIRKYSKDGQLVSEWHPDSNVGSLPAVLPSARQLYERTKAGKGTGSANVLYGGCFDRQGRTLWVAAGASLYELDGSGKTLRALLVSRPDGAPLRIETFSIDRGTILAGNYIRGIFMYKKPS